MNHLHRPLALAAIAFAALQGGPASANEATGDIATPRDVWLTSGFLSRHTSQKRAPRRGWNETNTGIGLECGVGENWQLAAGVYENSIYRTSHYAHAVWSPDATSWRRDGWRVQAGMAVGVVDGYRRMNGGGYFPTLLPVVSVTWRHAGLNLTYIPSLAGNVSGAVGLQFKIGFP